MVTVCQKCGDAGFSELLIYCIRCHDAAEHRYCLNEFPSNDEDVIWICEECKQKAPKPTGAASHHPPKKKCNEKHRSSIGCTEAKAKVSFVRHPSRVYAEDAHGSAGPSPSLPNDQNKCLSLCSEKSEKDGKIKRHRRRLILVDADRSDEESEPVKPARISADKDDTNRRAIQANESLCLYSLNNVSDYSALPLACSEAPDQASKSLQPISTGASERAIISVPYDLNTPSNIALHQPYDDYDYDYVHAQPIIDPVWRGCFDINNQNYRMVAHVSNKACSKVYIGVKMFSRVLSMKMLPRVDAWPKSFQTTPPTDDNIGIYFFPESERDEMVFSELLHEINDGDLSLKVIFEEVELLVFSSNLLPQQHSRFKGKYYLWGAFRSVPRMPGNGKRTLGNSTVESCVPIPVPASDDVPRSTCDEDQEANSLKRPRSPVSNHDSDNDELKLFPLEVEDMAVKARVRGRGGLDLELGLGRPVGEDGEALLCCKPRSGRTTNSLLALDNARSITLL